jgi:hypothetical protein
VVYSQVPVTRPQVFLNFDPGVLRPCPVCVPAPPGVFLQVCVPARPPGVFLPVLYCTGTYRYRCLFTGTVHCVPLCVRVSRVSRVCPGSPRCLTGTSAAASVVALTCGVCVAGGFRWL